jgi:hypothetical protein
MRRPQEPADAFPKALDDRQHDEARKTTATSHLELIKVRSEIQLVRWRVVFCWVMLMLLFWAALWAMPVEN